MSAIVTPLRPMPSIQARSTLARVASGTGLGKGRDSRDNEFLPAALDILESPPSPIKIAFIYTICGLVAAALIWSYFGFLDINAVASGKVQPAGRTKVIQPMEAGKVIAIKVADGDHVKAGDILVELDPTEAIATKTAVAGSLIDLRAEIQRRNAAVDAARPEHVITSASVAWDMDIPEDTWRREERVLRADLSQLAATLEVLVAQRRQKETQRESLMASIAAQKALIAVYSEHNGMLDALFDKGVSSRKLVLDVLQQVRQAETTLANLQGNLADAISAADVLDSDIVKTRESFVTDNTEKLSDALRKKDNLVQELAKATVKVDHMTLTAPVDGTIQAVAVTTIGQVVTTGQELLHVVPQGLPLEIEAYVLNADIGFVEAGQDAVIKVDSFPYTRYGTIAGRVTHVATDAIPGLEAQQRQRDGSQPPSGSLTITSAAQRTQDLVFPILITPAVTTINVDGKDVPLSAGMTVTVEVTTEKRRAIDYLLSPLVDLQSTAMRER
jgi:hemolysin D